MKLENILNAAIRKENFCVPKEMVINGSFLAETSGQPAKLIFTKIAPDVDGDTLEEIARIAMEFNIGLIATNTTLDHAALSRYKKEDGGLSGKPLRSKSNQILHRLYKLTKGVVPLIGVGGIFSAEDAYEKFRLGATLVQVYSNIFRLCHFPNLKGNYYWLFLQNLAIQNRLDCKLLFQHSA